MITSERMGRIYIDHVTHSAARRKPRRQAGGWWSLAIIAAAVGLLAINGV